MKSIILILVSLVSQIASATDWTEFIKEYPALKESNLRLDSSGHVEASIIQRKNKNLRFLGFNIYAIKNKPKLTINNGNNLDIKDLCYNSVRLHKPFNAKLEFVVDPLYEGNIEAGRLEQNFNLSSFENDLVLEPAMVEFNSAVFAGGWGFWDTESSQKAGGSHAWNYYLRLINEAIKSSTTPFVTVELSQYNAFACDLIDGNIKIKIKRNLSFEPGKPVSKTWLNSEKYLNIFKNFWRINNVLTFSGESERETLMKDAALAGYVASAEFEETDLFHSTQRIQALVQSLKANTDLINIQHPQDIKQKDILNNLMMNVEYSQPTINRISSSYTIYNGGVFLKQETGEKL